MSQSEVATPKTVSQSEVATPETMSQSEVVTPEDYVYMLKSMLTVQILSELNNTASSCASSNTTVSSEKSKKRRRCCASTVSGKKCRMFSLKEDTCKTFCTHHDKQNKKQQQSDIVAINTTTNWVNWIMNILLVIYSIIYLAIIISSFDANPTSFIKFLGPNLFNNTVPNDKTMIENLYKFQTPVPFDILKDDFKYMNQTF